jgi:hypothetical protein
MPDYLDISRFQSTVHELERLLDFNFLPRVIIRSFKDTLYVKRKRPTSDWIEQVFHDDRVGDIKTREYGLCRIAVLIIDLQTIENTSPQLLNYFRKSFRKHSDNEFWGLRFEIDIASTLIKKNISFQLGCQLPGGDALNGDFVCGTVAIECASIHAGSKKRFNSYLKKISRTIRKKKAKPYACSNVALFLDITNIFFERAFDGNPIGNEELRHTLRSEAAVSGFGSIVASVWFFNEDRSLSHSRYQNLLAREDALTISSQLSTFLSHDFELNQQLNSITKFTALSGY